MPSGDNLRLLIAGVLIAAVYAAAAQLGFLVAFTAEQITTVWAPTGIALAALLHWGRRLWPAIWVGAFTANAMSEAPLWTAGFIATGNTLEALVAASLLGRAHGFDPALRRVVDTVRFILVGALFTPLISAGIGVATLCSAGVQPWSRFLELMSAWWLGDALGALVVAPVLLTIARSTGRRTRRYWSESGLLILVAMGFANFVFGDVFSSLADRGPRHYLIFPFVVVAAVRFGQPTAAGVVLATSVVTIWHTVRAMGPLASPDIFQGLVMLQVFTGVLASTELLLAAAMTERQTSERRRNAAHAVGEVLNHAPDVAAAAPGILRSVCENLEWPVGAFWRVDEDLRQLRCLSVWTDGSASFGEFATATRNRRFDRGIGLPGRVWAGDGAVWIEDVVRDPSCPRAPVAMAAGLHGAFAFPVRHEHHVVGVVEFFTRRVTAPDADLLDAMSTVGNQVGQFMGRKRVEQAMLEEQRERERADRTLRASEEQLRDADRRKDEFLAMLAHELRNPLAPIRTGLELVRLAGDSREVFGQVRPMMERQVGHMVRLIDDLLDASRITSGKMHLQRAWSVLDDLVNGAVEANRVAIDTAGLSLSVQLATPRARLWVDPTRFVQVVSNLLHNASKFTDPGGHITIRAAVEENGSRRGELVLSVSDTGIGISEAMLPRIFDLFTQGERSTRRSQPGLGIGLALARRIVEMHGGRIDARSGGPGHGSEFTIHLPMVSDAGAAGVEGSEPASRKAFKRRVLVIDDNADAADMLATLVRALGGEAQTATDGLTGVLRAIEFLPDVVLLDIGMPGIDGYETCRRIRQSPAGDRAFIIAITGWGQDRDKLRATEAGFDAHLTKPADPQLLERLLSEARRP